MFASYVEIENSVTVDNTMIYDILEQLATGLVELVTV